MLRLGGFPHRTPDTFAGDATSSLPPAEPLCLLLELPTQQALSLLEHALEFCCPSSLSPGPATWYPLIFWCFQVAQAQFLAQNKHSKNVEWMAVNKPLGLQMHCYVDVILGCLFLSNFVSSSAVASKAEWILPSERHGFESQLCHS